MHRVFEATIHILRVEPMEISIGDVAGLHHLDETVAQFLA